MRGRLPQIVGDSLISGDPPLEHKLRFAPQLLTGLLTGNRVPSRERRLLENAFFGHRGSPQCLDEGSARIREFSPKAV
jgi:hypothetical protein